MICIDFLEYSIIYNIQRIILFQYKLKSNERFLKKLDFKKNRERLTCMLIVQTSIEPPFQGTISFKITTLYLGYLSVMTTSYYSLLSGRCPGYPQVVKVLYSMNTEQYPRFPFHIENLNQILPRRNLLIKKKRIYHHHK